MSSIISLSGMTALAQQTIHEPDAPPYTIPGLLQTADGKPVLSRAAWISTRRPELLHLFEQFEYGKVPPAKIKVRFYQRKTVRNAVHGKAKLKIIDIRLYNNKDSFTFPLVILLPAQASKPVPLFLGMNFYGNQTICADTNLPITPSYVINSPEYHISNNRATEESRGVESSQWQVEKIIGRGYGLATIYYGDVDPDFDDGFQNGIHPLFYRAGQNKPDSSEWGSIAAWAYALSRAMDYFETDHDINAKKVTVIGHSRLGKTALWAGIQDQRFAMVISNNSGCGGAALSKRIFGETVKAINDRFPHWFCKNFHLFNDKESELPFDQHMLLALVAPRPLYVASSAEDSWADPRGEFLSLYYAAPAYALFGFETFSNDSMPAVDQPVWKGNIGYHIRSGKHDITAYDWDRYLDFADLHFGKRVK